MMLFAEQVSGMTAFVAMFGAYAGDWVEYRNDIFVLAPSQPNALPWKKVTCLPSRSTVHLLTFMVI